MNTIFQSQTTLAFSNVAPVARTSLSVCTAGTGAGGAGGGEGKGVGREHQALHMGSLALTVMEANSLGTLVSPHFTHPSSPTAPRSRSSRMVEAHCRAREKVLTRSQVWPNHFLTVALRLLTCAMSQLPVQRFFKMPPTPSMKVL